MRKEEWENNMFRKQRENVERRISDGQNRNTQSSCIMLKPRAATHGPAFTESPVIKWKSSTPPCFTPFELPQDQRAIGTSGQSLAFYSLQNENTC
jgi:hypothetical protein